MWHECPGVGMRWLSQQIITLQQSVESWCETSSLCGCAPASRNYADIFWAASHKHTLTLTYHAEGIPVSYDLLKSQCAVDHISFCVCEITHTHTHTHTHSNTPKSNNSVDINKGAIIMNVIHSAEGKEKMSKDLLSLKLCAEAHVFWFSTVQGQMSPLFVH